MVVDARVKHYPSISRSVGQDFQEFDAHCFDKCDGSNLRFEFNRKRGWYKFGTRTRLFDQSDQIFGESINLFRRVLAEPLERIVHEQRWQHLIVFTEFGGEKSFAGLHEPGDPKNLTLFDAAAEKKGLIGPVDFRKLFEDKVATPKYLGHAKWTRGFVERVRNGLLEGVTFEGVVGKGGSRHELIMAKAKTQAWVDKVFSRYTTEEADKIVNS